jgi:hypothetical protein
MSCGQLALLEYNRSLLGGKLGNGNWASSLIWGTQAQGTGQHCPEQLSARIYPELSGANYAYTRLELLDKDELFPEDPAHPAYRIGALFGAYTFGAVRDLVHSEYGQVGLRRCDFLFEACSPRSNLRK